MLSFDTEIENPIVQKDIIDLEKKIRAYREGTINDEKFRSLRLARGVYGQRQPGVQMVRIKLPFGKMTAKQLLRICAVSDEFSTGHLHLTTRQDIQIHYISLERTPELWAKLEQDDVTLREACGNTVRNVTASANAGIDPEEPFDVTPYAYAVFRYFLRNPICQEMGRKFKIAFSSSEKDSAFTFMHDMGFIPKVRIENGQEVRGFKVLVAGGLGAQPFMAKVAYEFMHEDEIIPFTERVIRVFDRHGERSSRNKARMKFLVNKIGFETFMQLVEEETLAIKTKTYKIDRDAVPTAEPVAAKEIPAVTIQNTAKYEAWLKTNVFEQKQAGYKAVAVKVLLGNISTAKTREFVSLVSQYAADDIRATVNQGFLLRFVREEALPVLFTELDKLNLAEPGFDSTADITACPGTDTCNLGITSSTGITEVLEKLIKEEYPELIYNGDIKIKISGCMNACGQHNMVQIGFHGSSLKQGKTVVPALQVLLGGGVVGDGEGRASDKVIKVPSRRGPDVLRYLLDDYDVNGQDGEFFNAYYQRKGKDYFYQLLKPLADTTNLQPADLIDWGNEGVYEQAIGVGECAGVMIDLVTTLFYETDEKYDNAVEAYNEGRYADAIYHSYSVFVSGAKATLLNKQVNGNTHIGIINDFDKYFVQPGEFQLKGSFKDLVLQINQQEPTQQFAASYMAQAAEFLTQAKAFREESLQASENLPKPKLLDLDGGNA